MRYLLDSHTLLWAVSQPKELSHQAREEITSSHNVLFVSLASLWELRIKESLGKIKLPEKFYHQLPEAGYELLALSLSHIDTFGKLPFHHRDPFDRMLVAQAMVEQLILMTRDEEIPHYEVNILKS